VALTGSALGVALTLTFTAAASAQTPLQATVSASQRHGDSCTNGAFVCGTANLAGYGAGTWNLFLTGFTPVPTSCGSSYTATVEFVLASDPGSTLILDETGNICAPGLDAMSGFKEGSKAYGHPETLLGSWAADPTSTGQFAGLAGSGADLINTAGAHFVGTYTGSLA
jgi:hypothetical protein